MFLPMTQIGEIVRMKLKPFLFYFSISIKHGKAIAVPRKFLFIRSIISKMILHINWKDDGVIAHLYNTLNENLTDSSQED